MHEVVPIGRTRWEHAQAHEREYWCPPGRGEKERRRAEECQRQAFYGGLMQITPAAVAGKAVLDLGCGPAGICARQELMLARAVGVDPLTFDPEDEADYSVLGVERLRIPAEDLASSAVAGERFDEVWCYNLLQHVMDPVAVLAAARAMLPARVRLFEWVNVPPSVVHPHVITVGLVTHGFRAGWRCEQLVTGTCETPHWTQQFVAAVYERVTS